MKTNFSLEHYRNESKSKRIHKIVFTGGPKAGKTTSIELCADQLRDLGYNVFTIPECATHIEIAGVHKSLLSKDMDKQVLYLTQLIKMQMQLEDRYCEIAQLSNCVKPKIIICHRGVLDAFAYSDPDVWQSSIDQNGFNIDKLRDNRYDAVVHLVTAADGAAEFYQNDQIKPRYTIEQAIEIDQKLKSIWKNHQFWTMIDNSTSFQQKIKKIIQAINFQINPDSAFGYQKRYLLYDFDIEKLISKLNVDFTSYKLEENYLNDTYNTIDRRIIRRYQGDSNSYVLQESRVKFDENTIQQRRRITARDYMDLYDQRDHDRNTVQKRRYIFEYKGTRYRITDLQIDKKRVFIEALVQWQSDQKQNIDLEILAKKVIREITNDEQYKAHDICHVNWEMPEQDKKMVQKSAKRNPIQRQDSRESLENFKLE